MPNINLSSGSFENRPALREIGFNWGLVSLAIVFILSLALWGGLTFYSGQLDKKILESDNQYALLQKKLMGEKASEVVDFKDRLFLANGLNENGRNLADDFSHLEKVMIESGVNINNFTYDGDKSIQLDLIGNDYNSLARQVLSMKQSGYYSMVEAGASSFSAEQKKYTLEMSLKLK